MIPTALWYRHWLEIRGGLTVAIIWMALLCLSYPIFVIANSSASARHSDPAGLAAPVPTADAERFIPWTSHAWLCAAAALSVSVFIGGTGIRTNSLTPGHPSYHYTLALPVARFDLIWTRFAASGAAAVGLFAGMLLFNCAVLLLMGRPIPFLAMAASSLLAVLLLLAIVSVIGVAIPLWDERPMGLIIPAAGAGAFYWGWEPVKLFVASQVVPWNQIGIVFMIVGGALCLAAVVAHRRDF